MKSFNYSYNHENCTKDQTLNAQLFSTPVGENQWAHFGSDYKTDDLRELLSELGLHELWITNIFESENTIAPIELESGILLFLRNVSYSSSNLELSTNLLNIIWLPGGIITVSKDHINSFDPIYQRLKQANSGIRTHGSEFLLYKVLDSMSSQYLKTANLMEDELEEIELQMMNEFNPNILDGLHQMSKDLVNIRKCTKRFNETIDALFELESSQIDGLNHYFEDVHQRILNLEVKLRSLKDQIANLLQLNLNLMGMRTNEVMSFLTIVSSIFIPISFLAGLYGMNFVNMPELQSKNGYYYLLTVMASIFIISLSYFKKKKWI
ncbi:MAG: hypothetical protein KC646_03930 [Candidatus Cloacimonetes bacterium]|nr:hypothetical protein [Candidatus Cloacimonadota bacterium]